MARGAHPDDPALAAMIGKLKTHWDSVVALIEATDAGLGTEWKFYGEKHGWQFKVTNARKRAVLYMIPRDQSVTVAFVLNDRAFEAVRASALPPAMIKEIEGTKRYAEGRPARVSLRTRRDVDVVKKLLKIVLSAA